MNNRQTAADILLGLFVLALQCDSISAIANWTLCAAAHFSFLHKETKAARFFRSTPALILNFWHKICSMWLWFNIAAQLRLYSWAYKENPQAFAGRIVYLLALSPLVLFCSSTGAFLLLFVYSITHKTMTEWAPDSRFLFFSLFWLTHLCVSPSECTHSSRQTTLPASAAAAATSMVFELIYRHILPPAAIFHFSWSFFQWSTLVKRTKGRLVQFWQIVLI